MSKEFLNNLYQLLLKGLTLLFGMFNEVGVVKIDKWDQFVEEMNKEDE